MSDQPGIPDSVRAAISVPDLVPSPLGDLHFFDGLPALETVDTIYDLLDLVRGIEVYLNTIPGASLVAMREGFRSVGVDSAGVLGYTAPRANSGSFFLTANTETTYGSMFLDLKADGPTVIENPPNSLCVLDDFWFRYVADLGLAGPDQGAGGKYLILPPGYDGDEPSGYFTFRSPTFTNWLVVRALGGVEDIVKTRVYPLAQAGDPPQMTYLNIAAKTQNTVHANDFSFYEEINTLIQEEPAEALDPERAGQCAAIGIVKGQPFEPDERMRRILSQAAPLAAAAARAITYKPRDPAAYLYPGSAWLNAFIGGSYEFLRNHARLLDARAQFHYFATVITPAMAAARVGTGSAYAYTAMDANGDWLDGGQSLPAHPPGGHPGQELLVGRPLRHPDPLAAGDRQPLSLGDEPGGHRAGQRRRQHQPVLRACRARGQAVKLGADRTRQGLVRHAAALRAARTLVRQDLAARRDRTHHLTRTR